uniref:phosphopyruvate hydratase n=1 Tax=Parascaris equorum TaxID=6256 RepID=A0A914RK51_PAREQ
MISHRSGETEDRFVADFVAVLATGSRQALHFVQSDCANTMNCCVQRKNLVRMLHSRERSPVIRRRRRDVALSATVPVPDGV